MKYIYYPFVDRNDIVCFIIDLKVKERRAVLKNILEIQQKYGEYFE